MNIVETLFTGRPLEPRSAREDRCYDLLDSLSVEFFRVDHDHADTISDCELVEELLGCKICKNLFLTNRQQTDFYLLIMPGEKPFKTKLLSRQIGTARLSFGTPEQMERYLDTAPGSASVTFCGKIISAVIPVSTRAVCVFALRTCLRKFFPLWGMSLPLWNSPGKWNNCPARQFYGYRNILPGAPLRIFAKPSSKSSRANFPPIT